MTWVKLDDQFPDHPKVAGLTDGAFRLYVTGLCYASKHLTDGVIPEALISRWGVRHADRAASELMSAGLWTSAADHYEVHGYLERQRSRAEAEALSSKRAKAGKAGGIAKAKAEQARSKLPSKGVAETDDRGQRQRERESSSAEGQPCDDDPVARPAVSSSEDLDKPVWLAFATMALEDQAEPPANASAWMTAVARKARKERSPTLAELRLADPTAGPVQLARWLYENVDPAGVRSIADADLEPWEAVS